jgi:hypothetical protein
MMAAIESITSYPETYRQMRLESLEQAGHGIDQIKAGVSFGVDPSQEAGRESASGAIDLIKGVGNATLGTLGYITSPVNAAIRTAVGKPAQDLTGIRPNTPISRRRLLCQVLASPAGAVALSRVFAELLRKKHSRVNRQTFIIRRKTASSFRRGLSAGGFRRCRRTIAIRHRRTAPHRPLHRRAKVSGRSG